MRDLSFYLVDVFAEEKYQGNQLAVVKNASVLSASQMQKIANEMHFSETSFILSDDMHNGGFDVRIFTPANEVPFAGHPTLGTAFVIKNEIIRKPVDKVVLNLKVGQIPVTFQREDGEEEKLWMKQILPTFGKVFDAATVSKVLGLNAEEIDSRYPIQEVSTGLPFLIVPLKTLDAIKRIRTSKELQFQILEQTQSGILVFSPETYDEENDLNVRVFVELQGIPEDPATGSGNGCLAAFLSRYRYFGSDKVDVRVEQGFEIGRRSRLYLKAEEKDDGIHVSVGGRAVKVAEGKLV